jgi:hypothetical protein
MRVRRGGHPPDTSGNPDREVAGDLGSQAKTKLERPEILRRRARLTNGSLPRAQYFENRIREGEWYGSPRADAELRRECRNMKLAFGN